MPVNREFYDSIYQLQNLLHANIYSHLKQLSIGDLLHLEWEITQKVTSSKPNKKTASQLQKIIASHPLWNYIINELHQRGLGLEVTSEELLTWIHELEFKINQRGDKNEKENRPLQGPGSRTEEVTKEKVSLPRRAKKSTQGERFVRDMWT